MKKQLLILSILIQSAFFLRAQHYYPVPNTNVNWNVDENGPDYIIFTTYYSDNINKDTIINNINYTKIFENISPSKVSFTEKHIYTGAFRSDTSGKTYFIPADSLTEFLIIDLTKNKGDSVKNILVYGIPNTTGKTPKLINLNVDSVNYFHAGPYILKRMLLSNQNFTIKMSLFWIEKVGCNAGYKNYCLYPMYNINMSCMSSNDTIYYNNYYNYVPIYQQGKCDNNVGLNTDIEIPAIDIFPNPMIEKLYINQILQKTELFLYNLEGQLWIQKSLNPGKSEIELSNLIKGVYILKLLSNNNIYITKIIKE